MNGNEFYAIGIEKSYTPGWPGKTEGQRKTERIYPTTKITPVSQQPTPDHQKKRGPRPPPDNGEDKNDSIDEYA